MRDFSAYSGLWRWAIRRGHAEVSSWPDQTAGMKGRQTHDDQREEKRGYSSDELVKLLRAGAAELAPGRGGYAATFWDLIRLSLLTGGRASETLSLRVQDVLENGTVVVFSSGGGKTENAPRIMPLHPLSRACLNSSQTGRSMGPCLQASNGWRIRGLPLATKCQPWAK